LVVLIFPREEFERAENAILALDQAKRELEDAQKEAELQVAELKVPHHDHNIAW
jgi:hypothetical protein